MTPTAQALRYLNSLHTSQQDRNAIINLAEQLSRDDGNREYICVSHVRMAVRCVLGAKAERSV